MLTIVPVFNLGLFVVAGGLFELISMSDGKGGRVIGAACLQRGWGVVMMTGGL